MSPNYQKGKIYKIVSNQTTDVYIGSTIQPLSIRFSGHKCFYKKYIDGEKVKYVCSYEILKYDDAQIILVQNYPCKSKEELEAKEFETINNTVNCINKDKDKWISKIPKGRPRKYVSDMEKAQAERESTKRSNEKYYAKIKELREKAKVEKQNKQYKEVFQDKLSKVNEMYININQVCCDCLTQKCHELTAPYCPKCWEYIENGETW